MKKILIPTDFSPCAENAVGFAVQMAKILPAEIYLFYSFEIKGTLYSNYVGVNKEFNQAQLATAQEKLQKIQQKIKEEEGIDVRVFVSEYELHKAIKDAIKDLQVNFIIMGTRGASGIKEALMGSRTAKVIEESTVPVIAIPGSYTWKKPQHLLFITHHFEQDPPVLDFLFELADLLMAEVEIAVFVDENEETTMATIQNERQFTEYQNTLRKGYFERDLKGTRLVGIDLEHTLQAHLEENKIDMLVVITHKKGFWKRLFSPNISRTLSYHTHIPLLAIPD
ncbi:MAG: universal stress protein [Bacteroidota bacterium]|nr:universal stress protein [Bacteroidota bacterium]